ncbi:unnamed protein product [Hermetia illucens]|uniref:Transposase n=1 Tax=Hermetia illucens TaxID=343691 RepID=A0A7R8V3C9_HERIL|nr:unnamed protein product [Hermetia illucens]
MVLKVKKQIGRNTCRSGRKMAAELNIPARSLQRILQNEFKLKPLKFQIAHDLTPQKKKVRVERAKELLRRAESGVLPIFFSDEAPFTIEQFVNKQNDRAYLPERSFENLHLRPPESKQHRW